MIGMKCSAVLLLAATAATVAAQEDYKSDYFQYANVKGPKEYAHGYSRGNPHHHRTHHQRNKDHTFQAKVTWNDYSGGQGEHYIEYNHGPKSTGYEKSKPYAPEPYAPEPYAPKPYAPEPYAPKPYERKALTYKLSQN